MNNADAENLAQQIAALLTDKGAREDAGLRLAIDELNQRLDRIEARFSEDKRPPGAEPAGVSHPSVQRFASLGEIADVILERLNNQRDCPYEPAGKPCDNCSMCSSRGF